MTNARDNASGSLEVEKLTDEERIPDDKDLRDEHDDAHSKASDNESLASGGSDDSEMEPFPEYLSKIEQLLRDIGLAGYSVEPLHHGYSFMNCVYALKNPQDDKDQYILRVPNCPLTVAGETGERCEAILNDASLLEYLVDKLPVPRVKAYNVTTENALNTPFAVQTRLPGQSLDEIYEDLSFSEKLAIVDQFVELLGRLETIKFDTAGTFAPSSALPDKAHDFFTSAAPSIKLFDEGYEKIEKDAKFLQDRAGSDLKALLLSHLNGFIALELSNVEVKGTFRSERLRPLIEMIEDLDREGSFKDGPYPIVLHHWDLEPRNIMVEQVDGAWKICGVIDWDDAICVPRPLARRPPEWIWDPEPQEFTGYLDNDHDPTIDISGEKMELKAYFDAKATAVLPMYLEDAYGRGRWLRRIWTYARKEICQPYLLDRAEQFRKEWDMRAKTESQSDQVDLGEPQPEHSEVIVRHARNQKGLWKKSLSWLWHRFRTLRP